jgi:hypothetical protein
MTVAGVKMESASAGWMMRDGGRQVLGRVARMDEIKEVELETMSLGELMYYALVGKA